MSSFPILRKCRLGFDVCRRRDSKSLNHHKVRALFYLCKPPLLKKLPQCHRNGLWTNTHTHTHTHTQKKNQRGVWCESLGKTKGRQLYCHFSNPNKSGRSLLGGQKDACGVGGCANAVTVNDPLINARYVYLILEVQEGAFKDKRPLRERGVYFHFCNNFYKTNLLSAKI